MSSAANPAAGIVEVVAAIAELDAKLNDFGDTLRVLEERHQIAAGAERDELTKKIDRLLGKEARCEEERIVLLKKLERLESNQQQQHGT